MSTSQAAAKWQTSSYTSHFPSDPKQRCFEKDASLRLNVSLKPVVFKGEKGDAACGLRALS